MIFWLLKFSVWKVMLFPPGAAELQVIISYLSTISVDAENLELWGIWCPGWYVNLLDMVIAHDVTLLIGCNLTLPG